jgi:hypothetical protein
MSNLKFEITFVHHVTGDRIAVVVDLAEFTGHELKEAWFGPGKYVGPLAKAYAYQHATRRMSQDYFGLPASVTAHRLQ